MEGIDPEKTLSPIVMVTPPSHQFENGSVARFSDTPHKVTFSDLDTVLLGWPRRQISSASARNCSGDDLHHHANYPSQHDHYGPEDVRIFTKYDHTDRCKSRQRSEKCAYRTEKFCSINLSTGAASRELTTWAVKSERGSINSQVKPDCATKHHNEYKTLGGERRDAGPHMGANKQSACRSGHRKPNAFQHMGKFSNAGSHSRNPRSAKTTNLGHFSAG